MLRYISVIRINLFVTSFYLDSLRPQNKGFCYRVPPRVIEAAGSHKAKYSGGARVCSREDEAVVLK